VNKLKNISYSHVCPAAAICIHGETSIQPGSIWDRKNYEAKSASALYSTNQAHIDCRSLILQY